MKHALFPLKVDRRALLLCILGYSSFVAGAHTPDFYRLSPFLSEPRFARPWLSSWIFSAARGHATAAYNGAGTKVALPDLYTLSTSGSLPAYPKVTPDKLVTHELQADWYQNFTYGLFFHLTLPWRSLKLVPGTKELVRHQERKGLGNVVGTLGWALNYEETLDLDFIDLTLQLGVVAPTSCSTWHSSPLSLPLGYNRPGIYQQADLAFGIYDWLTIGAQQSAIYFFNYVCYPSSLQHDLMTGRGVRGTLLGLNGYVKADHIIRGFSCTGFYQYDHEFEAANQAYFTEYPQFKDWSRHALGIIIEYDFATYDHPNYPLISCTAQGTIAGRRAFDASALTGTLGISIAWGW